MCLILQQLYITFANLFIEKKLHVYREESTIYLYLKKEGESVKETEDIGRLNGKLFKLKGTVNVKGGQIRSK